jgi:hypothetical protein
MTQGWQHRRQRHRPRNLANRRGARRFLSDVATRGPCRAIYRLAGATEPYHVCASGSDPSPIRYNLFDH